ncbi:hypothetical protein SK128_013681 [Halocaridina rubra]|uniref:Myb/SANT-like DNA-binding domain-containing protein n=1 Tax=Halocaridina rubra TaxID=373956 RepID=A0AAN8WAN9_HALRR
MAEQTTSAFREVNLSDGKCNVSLYVCAEEEKKIDEDPDYASELFKAALEGRLPSAGDDDSDLGNISESESNETLDKRKPNKRDLDLGNISESESNETLDKRKPNKRGYWSSAATWTLIRSIKKNSHLLSKNPENRTELFEKARKELQEDGYRFDTNNIKKKYSNLLKTYARSKERLKNPNKGNMNWEFFYVSSS